MDQIIYFSPPQIEEIKIYLLCLNPIFEEKEWTFVVALSKSYERLKKYYIDNLLDEDKYIKDKDSYLHKFKKGPLYDFNPCNSLEINGINIFGQGIQVNYITEQTFNEICFHCYNDKNLYYNYKVI